MDMKVPFNTWVAEARSSPVTREQVEAEYGLEKFCRQQRASKSVSQEQEEKEDKDKEEKKRQALFTLDRCFGYMRDKILRKIGEDITSKNIAEYLKSEESLKLYFWETEFEIFTYENMPLDPQIYLDAMYSDPVISKMSGKGVNRICSWLSLFNEFVEIKRCGDKIFLCGASLEYENGEKIEDSDDKYNECVCKLPKEGEWEKISLLELLQKVHLSTIYVNDGSDCNNWVSFVEIGENDDYSI